MAQYKIGVLGTENSHASAFLKTFNGVEQNCQKPFENFEVTKIYGEYSDANQKLLDRHKNLSQSLTVEEMVSQVDCAMITARDGKHHFRFAMPFIKAGKPCFIDKPFTNNVSEAIELIKTAKKLGVPLCGGSSMKYNAQVLELKKTKEEMGSTFHGGYISAPLSFENEWGGFWFYSSHLAEMCMEVFGWNPIAATAISKNKSVHVIVEYEDFAVNIEFVENCYYSYCGVVTGEEKSVFKQIELDYGYKAEAEIFTKVVENGVMPHSYAQLIAPVVFLDAIERSFTTGKRVEIKMPTI